MALDSAKCVSVVPSANDVGHVTIGVDFFDSVDPATVLWHESIDVDQTTTQVELVRTVKSIGARRRQAIASSAAITAALLGGTVAVP